jgi:hypothetical protein
MGVGPGRLACRVLHHHAHPRVPERFRRKLRAPQRLARNRLRGRARPQRVDLGRGRTIDDQRVGLQPNIVDAGALAGVEMARLQRAQQGVGRVFLRPSPSPNRRTRPVHRGGNGCRRRQSRSAGGPPTGGHPTWPIRHRARRARRMYGCRPRPHGRLLWSGHPQGSGCTNADARSRRRLRRQGIVAQARAPSRRPGSARNRAAGPRQGCATPSPGWSAGHAPPHPGSW